MDIVNVSQKMDLIKEYWSPKILGEMNESYIKAAKLKGEFVWHQHESEDEMFFVVKGSLIIKLSDRDVVLEEGEFIVIPHGVEHMPVAIDEVQILMIEAKSTLNTGNTRSEKTRENLDWI